MYRWRDKVGNIDGSFTAFQIVVHREPGPSMLISGRLFTSQRHKNYEPVAPKMRPTDGAYVFAHCFSSSYYLTFQQAVPFDSHTLRTSPLKEKKKI